MKNYLEFEKEIKSLEQEVDGLKSPFGSEGVAEDDTQRIKNTQDEINEKLKETYANLNSWQRTQVARHEDRPKANFYIWLKLPCDDQTFAKLLYEQESVLSLPGTYLGKNIDGINPGEGFLRLAVVHDVDTINKAFSAVNRTIQSLN